MVRRLLIVPAICASTWIAAQGTLNVELVLSAPEAGGSVNLVLCPDDGSFKSEKGCMHLEAPATGGRVTVSFPDVMPGTYAIKVFHDTNGNGALDTNIVGMPKEPYGFSNDAMGTFGPPDFGQASFKVGRDGGSVRIRLKG